MAARSPAGTRGQRVHTALPAALWRGRKITGAINETEKIDKRAQTISPQKQFRAWGYSGISDFGSIEQKSELEKLHPITNSRHH